MNKKALKEFAVYARNELREQIALRAQAFGITPEGSPVLVTGVDYVEINENKYPLSYKNSIRKLLKEVETKDYDNVIEEVAYTWFNRLIAIRYMEVHNYLPSKVRMLSSETKGKVDPDILTEYQYTDLPVNKEEVASLLAQGNRDEAFRKLLVAQCNELNEIMPFLFEKLADFTELLLPESLLHADSLINRLVSELEESDFQEVEVIGWLYQFYMSGKKEQVGGLKNNAVKKEDLPVVTQLFTPKWIVQYMVQNSLGKLYDEWNPENNLVKGWEYYLKSSEKLPIPDITVLEEIKVIDPACGSGHILVYAFDMLYDMYLEAGYSERDISRLIIEKNLYGLDIDKRAVQIASFALMMKGQEKYRRFLKKANDLQLNIHEFVDSESISEEALEFLGENVGDISWIDSLQKQFEHAKQFGSLVVPKESTSGYLECIRYIESCKLETVDLLDEANIMELKEKLVPLLEQAYLLGLKYEVVVTNPPYHNKYNPVLKSFMNTKYKECKSDLYAAFMDRSMYLVKPDGFVAMITPFNWMFIKAYEQIRYKIINNQEIATLIQLEYNAFEVAMVPVCTFVLHNAKTNVPGEYIRLSDFRGAENQPLKTREAILNPFVNYRYKAPTEKFLDIPGAPIAYWASNHIREIIKSSSTVGELYELGEGLKTADNNRFLRYWHEISLNKLGLGYKSLEEATDSKKKWFPLNKGGEFKKWYGNHEYVVNYENNGEELDDFKNASKNKKVHYFKQNISWSDISSSSLSMRYFPDGFIFDSKGPSIFVTTSDKYELLGFLNSTVAKLILSLLNPTLTFKAGYIAKLPIISKSQYRTLIEKLVMENIDITRGNWDSFEESWNLQKHPFTIYMDKVSNLEQCYNAWEEHTKNQFRQIKENEEELNKIFIELYDLQDELTPEVPDKEVTIRCADRVLDTKSFLSYCIGLMMGRYSLDVEGLAYAGGEWDASKYKTFQPDSDCIIPLTDTAYFEDDVVARLQELLVLMFGQDTLAENLRWLAESLTMKNNETPVERLRRYFFDEFYSDHCKVYQKRPIYWMADSGKKKGFRVLFYLHRYTPETLATMRFSYVQNLQEKLSQEQKRLEQDLVNPDLTAAMKKRYNKQLTTIKAQQDELIDFDKEMAELANQRIALDLDDGVVVNYEKLKNILAKIK
ncbi:SAM-dependent methyltransferase [Bacillus cereus]|uniref:site-specific DNA-methyltransferase (adenine-specific) n=1 Tax=Bacillus cereus TaxID=1396 RepID=A0A2B2LPI5_BACCE|nr:BREX-1 system adenine-specific DNA-methyltransferase PglX [Bacillus cereus]PFQ44848.1 SAM-dependent methyltransferase [Bacillus cereus]